MEGWFGSFIVVEIRCVGMVEGDFAEDGELPRLSEAVRFPFGEFALVEILVSFLLS